MKIKLLILSLCVLCLTSASQKKKKRTIDDLGRAVFEMLQTNNLDGLEKIVLNEKQYLKVIDGYRNDDQEKERYKDEALSRLQKRDVEVKSSFNEIRNLGEEDSVNWGNALYSMSKETITSRDGVDKCYVEVSIFYQSTAYKVMIPEVIKFDEGWYYGFRKLRWMGQQ